MGVYRALWINVSDPLINYTLQGRSRGRSVLNSRLFPSIDTDLSFHSLGLVCDAARFGRYFRTIVSCPETVRIERRRSVSITLTTTPNHPLSTLITPPHF